MDGGDPAEPTEPTKAGEPPGAPAAPRRRRAGRRARERETTPIGTIEFERVVFFSDAVFAIAITLLVVDLLPGVPEVTDAGSVLRERIDSILGFLISFGVIGMFWIGHHGMFRHIKRLDARAIRLNLLLLGSIAFLPFPTALLSATSASTVATVLYAACVAAVGLFELLLWLHVARADVGGTDLEPAMRRHMALRIAVTPLVFLLSIPVAVVWPSKAPYTWLSLVALNAILSWIDPAKDRADDPDA